MSVLRLSHVTKTFPAMARPALADVSLDVGEGACVGLVGASGSGKSTLARVACGLLRPDSGAVEVEGADISTLAGRARRAALRGVQMVFQDHAGAFDPLMTLGASAVEFGRACGLTRAQARARAEELFESVGLPHDLLGSRPREVSGGQCQRAAIARALMVGPRLLVCDEVTSALDVSAQAGVVEVLCSLRGRVGVLFVTHDLALLGCVCERVVVMHEGRVVEEGLVHEVVSSPRDRHTRDLLDAARRVGESAHA